MQDRYPTTEGLLRGISVHIDTLSQELAGLRDEIGPLEEEKPTLGQCTLKADVDFEDSEVTLELSLSHAGRSLGSRTWRGPGSRLFELAVRRYIKSENSNDSSKPGTYTTDYILVCQDIPGYDPDQRTFKADTFQNTSDQLVRRFRLEIYTFVAKHTRLVDGQGKEIRKRDLMFQVPTVGKHRLVSCDPNHLGPRDLARDDQGVDDEGAAEREGAGVAPGPPSPRYLFVPNVQVGTFECNLAEARVAVENIKKENRPNAAKAHALCELLREHRRSIHAWDALAQIAGQSLGNLHQEDKDFVLGWIAPMVQQEADRFKVAKKLASRGASLCPADPDLSADLERAVEEFGYWAIWLGGVGEPLTSPGPTG